MGQDLCDIAAMALPPDRQTAWFFDVDGTLLEIAKTPAQARAEFWLLMMLHRLWQVSEGAVALISGRSVAMVDELLKPLRLPVAGQHGAEWRDVSGMHRVRDSALGVAAVRSAVIAWALRRPHLLLEDKGLSLAIHFRRAPQMESEVRRYLEMLVAANDALCLQAGKMVIEIKSTGYDKGNAIRDFMQEAPFQGRMPVFVGDDASDEHGFEFVNRLGGISIKVGEGPTVATWHLSSVAAVHRLLEHASKRQP